MKSIPTEIKEMKMSGTGESNNWITTQPALGGNVLKLMIYSGESITTFYLLPEEVKQLKSLLDTPLT